MDQEQKKEGTKSPITSMRVVTSLQILQRLKGWYLNMNNFYASKFNNLDELTNSLNDKNTRALSRRNG